MVNWRKMIKVEYDGEYPSMCMGRLRIYEDRNLIYNEKYCCRSTGYADIDEDTGDEKVIIGNLVWIEEERKKFSKEIQKAVEKKLEEFEVCCGGCM